MPLYHYLAMALLTALVTANGTEVEDMSGCTTLLTYNANMLPSYGNHSERKNRIPKALGDAGVDVVCLQGYWIECDLEILTLEETYGYKYQFSQVFGGAGDMTRRISESTFPCTQEMVDFFARDMIQCANDNGCQDIYEEHPKYGLVCLIQYCGSLMTTYNITSECFDCMVRYENSFFEHNLARCVWTGEYCHKQHNPSGLVLLSKKPMSNALYKRYFTGDNRIYQRGYLEADIEGLGKVICTQLTENIPLFFDESDEIDTYNEQQKVEITNLINTFGAVETQFLMGDFAVGPAVPAHNVRNMTPSAYDRLLQSGYSSPYHEQVGQCTFCKENGFKAIVDHIFFKGNFTTTAKRMFEDINDFQKEGKYGVHVKACPTDRQ